MLPQGRYEAICPQMCSHAPRIPTNGLDKPFLELMLVQRGLDKLASHCCASFFLSCGFKAKLGQNHCFETPQWPDSIYVVWCGSQHTEPTALTHCLPILLCPPSFLAQVPVSEASTLCLLCLCPSVTLGPWSEIPVRVCKDTKWEVTEHRACRASGHMQATSEPYIAGCRDAGTKEKQKGWTPSPSMWEALNDMQSEGTRLLFSLHFYNVQIWVTAMMPKCRKSLASALRLTRGHCLCVS